MATGKWPLPHVPLAKVMATRLAIGTQPCKGRNDVLFVGLAAWTVRPDDLKLRRDAMQIRARDLYYRACEGWVRYCAKQSSDTKQPVWTPAQIQLFEKHVLKQYFGRSGCLDAGSSAELPDHLALLKSEIGIAHRLLPVWFHILQAQRSGKVRDKSSPAIHIGADILRQLKKSPSVRTIERAWELSHPSIALSYAAAVTKLPDGKSMLDKFHDGDISYSEAKPFLGRWLGYAKFVHEEILTQIKPSRNRKQRFVDLSGVGVATTTPTFRNFSKGDAKVIEAQYGG
jgi:hypothetical protein